MTFFYQECAPLSPAQYMFPVPYDVDISSAHELSSGNEYPVCLSDDRDSGHSIQACVNMNNFLAHFVNEITKLRLNHNKANVVYKLAEDLVAHTKLFTAHLIEDNNGMNVMESLDASVKFICGKLSEHKSDYKRKKNLQQNELYVPPQEFGLGLRWDLIREHQTLSTSMRLLQCKYVSIHFVDRNLGIDFQTTRFA